MPIIIFLAVLVLAACTPAQIEGTISPPRLEFEKTMDIGTLRLERTSITGTEILTFNRRLINIRDYTDLIPFNKAANVSQRPSDRPRAVFIVAARRPGCARATFSLSITQRDYFLQELPGCGIRYTIENVSGSDPRNPVFIVGRVSDEVLLFGLDDEGRVERRELAAIPSQPAQPRAQPPGQSSPRSSSRNNESAFPPAGTPQLRPPVFRETSPSAPSSPSPVPTPSDAFSDTDAPPPRVRPRIAGPTLDATPEALPERARREAGPAPTPAPADNRVFERGTRSDRPVYDPSRETTIR